MYIDMSHQRQQGSILSAYSGDLLKISHLSTIIQKFISITSK